MRRLGKWLLGGITIGLPFITAHAWVLNNPYPESESNQKILYSSFPESPKSLDPAVAYNVNESIFIEQIDEPLLGYDYFKRPYRLVPLIAAQMPEVHYYRQDGTAIKHPDDEPVAYSIYRIRIKQGVNYQPHPGFVAEHLNLSPRYLIDHRIYKLSDFTSQGTRELVVDDFIYQIKRIASPYVNSPILGLMQDYIIGLRELNQTLLKVPSQPWIDLRRYTLSGVKKIDPYTFEIRIKGRYQPFLYWLAMHFFVPVPWEVDKFYSQPQMLERTIGFDWNPVGTGPFVLTENDPNRRMVLERNPNFREEWFPGGGNVEDQRLGYTRNVGKRLPLIDKAIYTLEKEAIPRWNKFLQGYYDLSVISADGFDQAIRMSSSGVYQLTPQMRAKRIRLTESFEPAIYYTGFNMLDPVVGGNSERARLLRQAISLAVNTEESIALFYNGRGQAAQGPLPPGIFGFDAEFFNASFYQKKENGLVRRSVETAKHWLRLAGYPDGIDPKTHRPLMITYDVSASGGPDERAQLEWMRKQFRQLGLSLNVQATQYNRFQDKMRTGNIQLFSWGWKADYPDPENFLFLLYGPNGKVKQGGENAANYANPLFDQLFNEMKNRKNDAMRWSIIQQMIQLLQKEVPWIWGFFSKTLVLSHEWISPTKPNVMMMNTLKYVSIDVPLREKRRKQWNHALFWPLGLLSLAGLIFLLPLIFVHRKRERSSVRRFE